MNLPNGSQVHECFAVFLEKHSCVRGKNKRMKKLSVRS